MKKGAAAAIPRINARKTGSSENIPPSAHASVLIKSPAKKSHRAKRTPFDSSTPATSSIVNSVWLIALPIQERPLSLNSILLFVTCIRPSCQSPRSLERALHNWYCLIGISCSHGAIRSGTIFFPLSKHPSTSLLSASPIPINLRSGIQSSVDIV